MKQIMNPLMRSSSNTSQLAPQPRGIDFLFGFFKLMSL